MNDARIAPKTLQINVRLPQPMGKQIVEIARRESNSQASVCRRLIAASLDREQLKQAPR